MSTKTDYTKNAQNAVSVVFFSLNNEYLTLTHTNSHDLSFSFHVGVFIVSKKSPNLKLLFQIVKKNKQWHLCATGTTCLRLRSKNYTGSLFSAGVDVMHW